MPPGLALSLLAVVLGSPSWGCWSSPAATGEQADLLRLETLGARGGLRRRVVVPLDRRLIATRSGRRLHDAWVATGEARLLTVEVALLAAGVLVLSVWLAGMVFAPLWAALCGFGVLVGDARRPAPPATPAARPVPRADARARPGAGERHRGGAVHPDRVWRWRRRTCSRRSGTEIARVTREVQLGASLDEALAHLEHRLPGRELSVLVGTLIIAQRSGGSLITALRNISETLEDRKELNREIRTVLTQVTYTGYLVAALGVGPAGADQRHPARGCCGP